MLLYPDSSSESTSRDRRDCRNDRLPRFDDREHLPYINALALVVSRWHTVGPLGEYEVCATFYADTYDI